MEKGTTILLYILYSNIPLSYMNSFMLENHEIKWRINRVTEIGLMVSKDLLKFCSAFITGSNKIILMLTLKRYSFS